MLPKLKIATPCPADWNKMAGDDKVRFCSLCNLNVYNLSAMTEPEVLNLLQMREGRLCARMFQRGDGTILTQDCPVGLRARFRRMTRLATAALVALVATPLLHAGAPQQKDSLVQIRPGETGLIVTVLDSSGAVIPGAHLELFSNGKSIAKATADNEGFAHFAALAPGEYTVAISSPGFKQLVRIVSVSAAAITKLTSELQIEQDGFIVGILAEEPQLEFENQQLESVIPVKMLPSIPIPGGAKPKVSNR